MNSRHIMPISLTLTLRKESNETRRSRKKYIHNKTIRTTSASDRTRGGERWCMEKLKNWIFANKWKLDHDKKVNRTVPYYCYKHYLPYIGFFVSLSVLLFIVGILPYSVCVRHSKWIRNWEEGQKQTVVVVVVEKELYRKSIGTRLYDYIYGVDTFCLDWGDLCFSCIYTVWLCVDLFIVRCVNNAEWD